MSEWSADDLPGVLSEIAELIGLPATERLVERWGGLQRYIPEHAPPGHWLRETVGAVAAARVCARFGRERLDIPKAQFAIRRAVWERIKQMRSAGASVSQISTECRLTERRVWQILREARIEAESRQQTLF